MQKKSQPQSIEDILIFWFGHRCTATAVAEEKTELWWSKNNRIDQEIIHRFAATTESIVNGELDHWRETPHGLLALIICTDQFPRNMYRDTANAFSYDSIALDTTKYCIDSGAERHLKPIERVFAYLPFEHSETLIEQQRSITLYQTLLSEMEITVPNESELFRNYYEFAKRHYDVIARFGRFPHRNHILGRPASEEEKCFLTQRDSSF